MTEESSYWRRLRRRDVLRRAAWGGAGLAMATMVGCRGEQPAAAPGAPAAPQAKRGGTLVRKTGEGVDGFSATFDPHVVTGAYSGIMGLFYQSLVRPNPRDWTQVEPELGQKWQQPSPTEYIFTLAPNVKWHNKPPVNGRALTAEDVVYSLNRSRTPEPRFINRSFLASVDKIEAAGSDTVRVTTKEPDATLLQGLADLSQRIVAREVIERFDRLTTPDQVIGTGAFILQTYDEGVSAALVRNPDYWKPGLPYLDGIRLLNILDPQTAWAAFLARQIDISHIPGTEAKRILAEQTRPYAAGVFKSIEVFMIWTNTQRRPFDDPRVTRALRLLVDHQEVVTGWLEPWHGSGTSFILPHSMEGFDLSPAEYAQTLEWKQPKDEAAREALALLSAAGFTRENPLRFTLADTETASTAAAAQLLQAQWRRLSQGVVQPELQLVENAVLVQMQTRGDFEVSGPTTRQSQTDPDQVFRAYYYTNGSNNFGKYSDPALDQLIDRQRAIFDAAQRKAAIKDVIKYVIEKAPYTTWGSRDQPNAWQSKVKDYAPEPIRVPGHQYEHIWLDV